VDGIVVRLDVLEVCVGLFAHITNPVLFNRYLQKITYSFESAFIYILTTPHRATHATPLKGCVALVANGIPQMRHMWVTCGTCGKRICKIFHAKFAESGHYSH
jgi:hypothetical protein